MGIKEESQTKENLWARLGQLQSATDQLRDLAYSGSAIVFNMSRAMALPDGPMRDAMSPLLIKAAEWFMSVEKVSK